MEICCRWKDNSGESEFGPLLILQNKEVLAELKKCSSLRNLLIQFCGKVFSEWDKLDWLNCWTNLKGFHNLTSLELYIFYGKGEDLIPEMTQLLGENRGLRTLGLGMKCEDHGTLLGYVLVLLPPKHEFLEKL